MDAAEWWWAKEVEAIESKVQEDLSVPSRVNVKDRVRPFKGKGQLGRIKGEFEGGRWEEFG